MPTVLPPDPFHFYRQIHPVIHTLSGIAFPTHSVLAAGETKAKWSNGVGMLLGNAPGTSVSLGISVAGRLYGTQQLPVRGRAIASISMIVRTPVLYTDSRTLSVAYQVRDSFGHTQVDIPAVSQAQPLLMIVSTNHSYAQTVIPCYAPNPVSGINTCTGEISNTWFSMDNDTTVEVFIITNIARLQAVSSSTEVITLHKSPDFNETYSNGMTFSVPTSPQAVGEFVDIPVRGNAGDQTLSTWNLTMKVNKLVLHYVSFATSEIYRPCTVSRWTDPDGIHEYISLSSSGIGQFVNSTKAAGNDIDLVAVRFIVTQNNTATSTVYHKAVRVFVNDMITVMTQFLVQKVWASVKDHKGFVYRSPDGGDLTVAARAYVGIMAYSANSDVINTAVLTGESTYSPINVEAIVNGSSADLNDVVTSMSACSVDTIGARSLAVISSADSLPSDTVVMLSNGTRSAFSGALNSTANCVVEANKYALEGSDAVLVQIHFTASGLDRGIADGAAKELVGANGTTLVGLNTSVSFRVWLPSVVNMRLDDATLNRII